jgi:hypothetical protein
MEIEKLPRQYPSLLLFPLLFHSWLLKVALTGPPGKDLVRKDKKTKSLPISCSANIHSKLLLSQEKSQLRILLLRTLFPPPLLSTCQLKWHYLCAWNSRISSQLSLWPSLKMGFLLLVFNLKCLQVNFLTST